MCVSAYLVARFADAFGNFDVLYRVLRIRCAYV